jgi:hypothetical protein
MVGITINRLAALAAALCSAAGSAVAAYDGTSAELKFSYRGWDAGEGVKGWQIFAPLTTTSSLTFGEGAALDINLRTGYVVAEYREPGFKGHVATWTDTVVGFDFTFPGAFGEPALVPFLTWDFNLPTGRATLYGDEKGALMDPDLVDLVRFGEGFNFNLVAGFAWALDDNWTLTLGAGMNWRGGYTPDGDTGFDYNPGDQVQGIFAVQYADETALVSLTVKTFDEQMGTLDGLDYFDPGDSIDATLRAIYAIDPLSSLQATLFYSTSGKNRYLNFFTGEVETEPFNGNGAVWYGQLAYAHQIEAVNLTGYVTYRKREKNDFDPVNDLFIPARTQWSVGASATYDFGDGAAVEANASFGRVSDDATVFTGAERDIDTYTVSLSGRVSF